MDRPRSASAWGSARGRRNRARWACPAGRSPCRSSAWNDNPVPAGVVGEAVWRPTEPFAIFLATGTGRPRPSRHGATCGSTQVTPRCSTTRATSSSRTDQGLDPPARREHLVVRRRVGARAARHRRVRRLRRALRDRRHRGGGDGRRGRRRRRPAGRRRAVRRAVRDDAPPRRARYLRVVAELPKTPTQRVQKFKLRRRRHRRHPRPRGARHPPAAIDRTIWAARAPFPDLGGSQRGFCYRTPPRSTKVAATVRIS